MIIAGSRTIDGEADYQRLKTAVMKFPKPDEIVSGGAKGADKLGERLAAGTVTEDAVNLFLDELQAAQDRLPQEEAETYVGFFQDYSSTRL